MLTAVAAFGLLEAAIYLMAALTLYTMLQRALHVRSQLRRARVAWSAQVREAPSQLERPAGDLA